MIARTSVLALVALITPFTAAAATISFQHVGNAEVVSLAVKNGSTVTNLTGWAGELDWAWVDGKPAGASTDLYTYCVDLVHDAQYTQTVTAYGIGDLQTVATNGAQKAAWLFNTFAAYVHDQVNASYLGAGLQLAIWEVLYDNSYSLTGSNAGNFKVTSASQAALTAANSFLSELIKIGDGYLTADATILDVRSPYLGQDQMTFAAVPEPATVLLLGTGVAGLVARHRKRSRQS